MRIELSEKHKFIQVFPSRTMDGSTRICKYDEGISKNRQIGEIKIKQEDLSRVLVAVLLKSGIEAREVLAELFGQISDYDTGKIEYLIRVGR